MYKQVTEKIKNIMKNSKIYIGMVIITGLIFGFLGGLLGVWWMIQYGGIENNVIGSVIQKKETVKLTEDSAIIDTVKKVQSAVVSITVKSEVQSFYGPSEQDSEGSGFIIDKNGLILTNKHVASSNTSSYIVTTYKGETYDAKLKATDPLNDLAILKIEAKDLPVLELGDSDDMQIGQRVIAIGNALGEFDNTVTTGVLSAKDRDITASSGNGSSSEELSGLLQTDAAINQGNSGGPLVNILGQVIGINTAAAQSAENLGFAIPSNMAKSAIASYQKSGKISRPMIGVRYISNSKEIAEQNSLPSSEGVIVYSGNQYLSAVISGSPADKIGLKQYDIIIQIDDKKINAENTLRKILLNYKVGDKIKIKYLRDGKEKTATLKLSEAN